MSVVKTYIMSDTLSQTWDLYLQMGGFTTGYSHSENVGGAKFLHNVAFILTKTLGKTYKPFFASLKVLKSNIL